MSSRLLARPVRVAALALASLAACAGTGKATPAASPQAPAARPAPIAAATPAPGPRPTHDAAPRTTLASASGTGIAACDAYLVMFDKLLQCDDAKPALAGLEDGVAATRQGWAAWRELTPDERAAAARAATPGCQAGTEALVSIADSLGCPR